jgi:hypothetical protein
MLVEHKAVDAGIAQAGLRPGQADDVVRPKKLFQTANPRYPGMFGRSPALHCSRCDMLADYRTRQAPHPLEAALGDGGNQ